MQGIIKHAIVNLLALLCSPALTIAANAEASGNSTPPQSSAPRPSTSQKSPVEIGTLAAKVPAGLVQMGTASPYYSPFAFVVDKKARTLTVWSQESNGYRPVAQFPADLGKTDGDKRASGDYKTPEGVYFLIDRLEGPGLDFNQYGKRAFVTDYPNFFDLREGKTGSGIWLHAIPDQVPMTRGSRGCVVVRNDVIQNLTPYVRLKKTPILIEQEVEYVDAEDLRSQAKQLTQMVESWRLAWEQKNLERYIAYYGNDFKAMNMGREQWKSYKNSLNQRYEQLAIKLSRPVVLRYKDRLVARFLQSYTSDQHTDFGEKTLYIKKGSAGLQIVGEEWHPDPSNVAREEMEAGPLALKVCSPSIDKDCASAAKASTN